MKKLGMLFAGLVAAASLGLTTVGSATGAPVMSAVYPPTVTVTIIIAPNPAQPGATIVVTFTGCSAGETVQITLGNVSVTVTCSGPSGTLRMPMAAAAPAASTSLTAPTAPGRYTITATGLSSGATASGTLTVAVPSAGRLPTTGSDSSSTVQVATLAVMVGSGLLLVGFQHRRRHS
jgi:LPXTG-motif cell wall-anchored protein